MSYQAGFMIKPSITDSILSFQLAKGFFPESPVKENSSRNWFIRMNETIIFTTEHMWHTTEKKSEKCTIICFAVECPKTSEYDWNYIDFVTFFFILSLLFPTNFRALPKSWNSKERRTQITVLFWSPANTSLSCFPSMLIIPKSPWTKGNSVTFHEAWS